MRSSACHKREVLTPRGIIVETFETAINWNRFADFHAQVKTATEKAILEVTGKPVLVTCRFTHVYPGPWWLRKNGWTPRGCSTRASCSIPTEQNTPLRRDSKTVDRLWLRHKLKVSLRGNSRCAVWLSRGGMAPGPHPASRRVRLTGLSGGRVPGVNG